MQIQDFIMVRHNPAYVHSPLALILILRLLIQDFQTKPSSNIIGSWFQLTFLDFWL